MPCYAERRELLRKLLTERAAQIGGTVIMPEDLLERSDRPDRMADHL